VAHCTQRVKLIFPKHWENNSNVYWLMVDATVITPHWPISEYFAVETLITLQKTFLIPNPINRPFTLNCHINHPVNSSFKRNGFGNRRERVLFMYLQTRRVTIGWGSALVLPLS
jgi:hypothetical protein